MFLAGISRDIIRGFRFRNFGEIHGFHVPFALFPAVWIMPKTQVSQLVEKLDAAIGLNNVVAFNAMFSLVPVW